MIKPHTILNGDEEIRPIHGVVDSHVVLEGEPGTGPCRRNIESLVCFGFAQILLKRVRYVQAQRITAVVRMLRFEFDARVRQTQITAVSPTCQGGVFSKEPFNTSPEVGSGAG
jgi:hypothetical protein